MIRLITIGRELNMTVRKSKESRMTPRVWPTWNGGVAFPRKGRKLRSHQILRWDVIVAVGCTGVELREEIHSGK